MAVQFYYFKPFVDQSSWHLETMYETPSCQCTCPIVYHVSFRRYRSLKLPLSCKVVEKRWFLGPRFVEGGDAPDFGHAFSNRTHLWACDRFWLSSVWRAQRVKKEYKKTHVFVMSSTKPTDCNKVWYMLCWVNLPYRNVNAYHLTWIMSLHYLVKLRIRILQVNGSGNC